MKSILKTIAIGAAAAFVGNVLYSKYILRSS